MLKLIDRTYYEILKLLKDHDRLQVSRIPEIVKTASPSTVYIKLDELAEAKLIRFEWDTTKKKPLKYYYLTEYGKAVLEKLEEVERLLQQIAETPSEEEKKELINKAASSNSLRRLRGLR